MMRWARWHSECIQDRIIKQETVGAFRVSTVFLGLDHRFDEPYPVLFETMVFPINEILGQGWSEEWCDRCGTEAEALVIHSQAVAWCHEQMAKMARCEEGD